MLKVLKYSSFILVGVVVFIEFITATNYSQLAIASIVYIISSCLALIAFPDSEERYVSFERSVPVPQPVKIEEVKVVKDTHKRDFLKLIGATGISFLIFSIFTKKARNSFLGNALLPTSGSTAIQDKEGNVIDPVQSQPTDGFSISEIDNNLSVAYYGFTNKDGAWFIMKEDADTGSYRYIRGSSDFSSNWSRRDKLGYDYFNNTF
jgi:hypothetical protein